MLIDVSVFMVTLALNGPVVAINSLGHQVNANIAPAYLISERKISPKPDPLKTLLIDLVGLEKINHEFFETGALVSFGSGLVSVFI
jgi:hypothetical protein